MRIVVIRRYLLLEYLEFKGEERVSREVKEGIITEDRSI